MPKLPRSTSSATTSMASGTIPSRPAKPYPDRLKIMHLFPDRPLGRAGFEQRLDHRSHADRGLELEPTEHQGVHATGIERKGGQVERGRLDARAANRNADLIREKPEQVLVLITGERSVFDRHDIARALHRAIHADPREFQNAFARVLASPELVQLQDEQRDARGRVVEAERFTTRRMVDLERGMAES